MIKKGDPVKIKPQWLEPGEEIYTYVAVEDQIEGRDNIKIMATNTTLQFPPVNGVLLSMLVTEDEARSSVCQ